jgi:hypothetical protein
VSARTFEELCGPTETCGSLAYWLGVYRGPSTDADVRSIADSLARQYDVEEQADRYGRVFPEDTPWPRMFRPVAPIQLTRAWSPAPRAVEIIGPPGVECAADGAGDAAGAGVRTFAATWPVHDGKEIAARLRAARSTDPVEKRFLGLLAVAVPRAAEHRAQLLLAARPGWSYEHDRIPRRARTLMTKAGFAVTTRTPQVDD